MEIIKNLVQENAINALLVLGIIREVRLFVKLYLHYKLETKKLTTQKDGG